MVFSFPDYPSQTPEYIYPSLNQTQPEHVGIIAASMDHSLECTKPYSEEEASGLEANVHSGSFDLFPGLSDSENVSRHLSD